MARYGILPPPRWVVSEPNVLLSGSGLTTRSNIGGEFLYGSIYWFYEDWTKAFMEGRRYYLHNYCRSKANDGVSGDIMLSWTWGIIGLSTFTAVHSSLEDLDFWYTFSGMTTMHDWYGASQSPRANSVLMVVGRISIHVFMNCIANYSAGFWVSYPNPLGQKRSVLRGLRWRYWYLPERHWRQFQAMRIEPGRAPQKIHIGACLCQFSNW